MFQWLSNFGQWLVDIIDPFIAFFKSLVHGLITLVTTVPKVFQLTTQAIGYVPSIFAVFITITIAVYVAYLIFNRQAGDS